jgi:hypothetical protein
MTLVAWHLGKWWYTPAHPAQWMHQALPMLWQLLRSSVASQCCLGLSSADVRGIDVIDSMFGSVSCAERYHAEQGDFAARCLLCRLLSRANSLHNRLYTEAYGCGRKGGSRQMQRCLDSIQDVLAVLSSYRCGSATSSSAQVVCLLY